MSATTTPPTAIARVAVDVPLPHLDRFFDYAIAEQLRAEAVPGTRVRVRFSGQLRDGFIVEVTDHTEVTGKLAPLTKVISAEPVLSSQQIRLVRAVADHWAGTFADVVRLAVPPRHATTERAEQRTWPAPTLTEIPTWGGLGALPAGQSWLQSVGAGGATRAFWQVPPSFRSGAAGLDDWTLGVTQAAAACLASGRGVIVVVPDRRDLDRGAARLRETLGSGCLAELHADLGPSTRYRNYLAIARGQAKIVIGTRGAVFAPMHDLGLVVVVDEGNDLFSEPRAPYPHARDVAAMRAAAEGAALLLLSGARSCEAQQWVERGWLVALGLDGAEQRRVGPSIRVAGDSDQAMARDPAARQARLPALAFDTIRTGLTQGPVLVQVARAGYLVALTCQRCRTPVRCPHCAGPIRGSRQQGSRQLDCGWCARIMTDWSCATCGGRELRAPVVGSGRTAEELGRAFPGYRLIDSSGDRVIARVGEQPALVVATPGGEPVADHGYAAAVLLDAAALLNRQDLRAGEEALRRWLGVVALVRPGEAGGSVCVVGPSEASAIQALVRLDPASFASRELAERHEAGFPPAVRMITLEGEPEPLRELVTALDLPTSAQLLGPVGLGEGPDEAGLLRVTVRSPLTAGRVTVAAVKAATAIRSARKDAGSVRVRVDPVAIS